MKTNVKAMKPKSPTGARAMLDRGFVQVTVYLHKDTAAEINRIMKRTGQKRSRVILGFVLDGLKREGKS